MSGNNTTKLELPTAGGEIVIDLGHNDNGKITLTIANWKDARYYLTVNYRTQYNQKQARLGWIACDGDDWDLNSFPDTSDRIDDIKRIIGGAVMESI